MGILITLSSIIFVAEITVEKVHLCVIVCTTKFCHEFQEALAHLSIFVLHNSNFIHLLVYKGISVATFSRHHFGQV